MSELPPDAGGVTGGGSVFGLVVSGGVVAGGFAAGGALASGPFPAPGAPWLGPWLQPNRRIPAISRIKNKIIFPIKTPRDG